jgi:Nif-specific regulatory protein
MAAAADEDRYAKLKVEHDLYFRLLNLGRTRDLMPLLGEALALITGITGVTQGYLELYDDDDLSTEMPRWWISHGFSDSELAAVRSAISRGIIAEAVASGQTIVTHEAFLDPRFSARDSVKLGKIEAVLCAPVGEDPPRGVLYLQGRAKPGLFSDEERERAELFAHTLARLVDPLLAEHKRAAAADATAPVRATLRTPGLIGRSEALAAVLKQVAAAAPLDVTLLLTGDSGTGKSALAKVVHENSPRGSHAFVEVNCGALPENLVENELFGSAKGAHSTADRRISGKVEAAERGTLFLDEIGALPLAAQAKLLQLLQSKRYFQVGGSTEVRADVRIIAATNLDLQQAVAGKQFREDLYYRLLVLTVRVPTLAERREDIAELLPFFCREACRRHGFVGISIARDATRAAQAAEWPGNVRQLENRIEAAVIRCAGEQRAVIERRDLFPEDPSCKTGGSEQLTFQEATRRFQEKYLLEALEETGWNIVETARRLDLARSHVYNLIRIAGLTRRSKGA